jgi:hypothetical protein
MMRRRLFEIDLAEARKPLADPTLRHQGKVGLGLDLGFECNFRPRKEANRSAGIADFGKTARHKWRKPRNHQLLAGRGGTGSNVLQAVIAHQKPPY